MLVVKVLKLDSGVKFFFFFKSGEFLRSLRNTTSTSLSPSSCTVNSTGAGGPGKKLSPHGFCCAAPYWGPTFRDSGSKAGAVDIESAVLSIATAASATVLYGRRRIVAHGAK